MRDVFRKRVPAQDVQQGSSHSEVDQESATGFESNNQILAATTERRDTLGDQLGCDLARVERARQTRVEDFDVVEAAAEEHGLEPATDGLDLRQLGHVASLVRGSCVPE